MCQIYQHNKHTDLELPTVILVFSNKTFSQILYKHLIFQLLKDMQFTLAALKFGDMAFQSLH